MIISLLAVTDSIEVQPRQGAKEIDMFRIIITLFVLASMLWSASCRKQEKPFPPMTMSHPVRKQVLVGETQTLVTYAVNDESYIVECLFSLDGEAYRPLKSEGGLRYVASWIHGADEVGEHTTAVTCRDGNGSWSQPHVKRYEVLHNSFTFLTGS